MNNEYIITDYELQQKGLNLSDYALDETMIPAIINNGLDIAVSRCCYLNDSLYGEEGLAEYLASNDEKLSSSSKVSAFKKLQYRIIYNLIFQAEESPVDLYVDTIIVHELKCGKINGFQKGLWYKNY